MPLPRSGAPSPGQPLHVGAVAVGRDRRGGSPAVLSGSAARAGRAAMGPATISKMRTGGQIIRQA
jgi:hypothetical protein